MKTLSLILLLSISTFPSAHAASAPFLWGVANSAFQVEGSPKDSDIYRDTHTKGYVKDGSNADIATDFWNRYDEDFALAQNLGVNGFRMSIAWERIEPARGQWDEDAIAHYEKMILAMRARGIEPVVTLFHNVLPIWVSEKGAMLSPTFTEDFAEFASHTVDRLANGPAQVHYWLTFNEPTTYAEGSYMAGGGSSANFLHLIRAQSKAHIAAFKKIKALANADKIKIGYAQDWEDFEVTNKANLPNDMALYFTDRFYNRGFLSQIIKAMPGGKPALDYLGINYYTRSQVKFSFKEFAKVAPGPGPESTMGMEICPDGFEKVLKRAARYKLPILVTENGVTDINDSLRPKFLEDHIHYLLKAIQEDLVNVIGYMHWSLTDNFEWESGLSQHYGLVAVDYSTLVRTPKPSYYVYKKLIEENKGLMADAP
jgi:beta-glucosidase